MRSQSTPPTMNRSSRGQRRRFSLILDFSFFLASKRSSFPFKKKLFLREDAQKLSTHDVVSFFSFDHAGNRTADFLFIVYFMCSQRHSLRQIGHSNKIQKSIYSLGPELLIIEMQKSKAIFLQIR